MLQAQPLPKLITVCAPPGYGKTVLLSRLHEEFLARDESSCWVSLDDRDSDLSSVLYRIRAALLQSQQNLATDSAESTPFHDRGASTDGVLKLLADLHRPTTLFIDNLGFCEDPALGPFLERLVFGTGAQLHLALSSTHEIPVDVVRAKLEVSALELGRTQLSFDRVSTARLLQQAGIASASEHDLDRILSHTEGWPAAVRLLQVLMSGEPDVARSGTIPEIENALQRLSGDHSDVARVLTRRVLVGFNPKLVQFMIEIALMREFSTELAAHMTGCIEAREWLNLLVARNVLIFPLDHNRRWFRFHTLLREFLLAEAQERVTPQRRRELLNRAARWHVGQGDNITAISIALEAGELNLARELLDRIAHVVVGDRGQMATLIQWVNRLQAAGVTPSVEAHAWFVWALCDSLQYERALSALDEFDRRMALEPTTAIGSEATPSRLLFVHMLVNVWVDRLDTAFDQAVTWLSRGEVTDAMTLSTVTSIAGIAEIDRGDLAAARARMGQAQASISRSDSAYGKAWVAILRACVEIGQARPDIADELLSDVHEQVSAEIGKDASVVVTLDFVHARALLDLGRVDAARKLAVRGLDRAMHHGIMTSLEQGLIACAAFWSDAPDDAVQGQLLDRVAHSYPMRGQCLLAASQVRRLIQLGRAADALTLAERHGLTVRPARKAQSAPSPLRERGDWMLARLELLLAQGACDEVLGQVEPLLKAARLQERQRDRIELLLLAADAHQRLGQVRMAVRHLSLAIVLATPGKLLQPFKLRQGLLGHVLTDTSARDLGLTRDSERSFLERLGSTDPVAASTAAAESRGAPADEAAPVATGLPTLREIQLLTLLDQGLNNEQVADRMSLSVPTVKWHLHNAYVKLGVRSRAAALARARALNLIRR